MPPPTMGLMARLTPFMPVMTHSSGICRSEGTSGMSPSLDALQVFFFT